MTDDIYVKNLLLQDGAFPTGCAGEKHDKVKTGLQRTPVK